ncbi:MAG: hypothetical protein R3211_10800, partial [Balneolaceae bacterium]|nr:hypothetical protein [Balneolaceae bacterium]
MIRRILPGILWVVLLVGAGCSSTRPYTLETIKTFDPDTARIDRPFEAPAYQWWDRINNTIFHQMEKPLDLNRTFRFIGKAAGIAGSRQADNINHLDEPPESSWYTYRDFYYPMTVDQIRRGPNTVPPDTGSKWTIFRAKLSGATSGFFIRDSKGDRYLIKFDGYNYPELATGAEVIGSKIFHAAGYTVPEATIVYFEPDSVVVG